MDKKTLDDANALNGRIIYCKSIINDIDSTLKGEYSNTVSSSLRRDLFYLSEDDFSDINKSVNEFINSRLMILSSHYTEQLFCLIDEFKKL